MSEMIDRVARAIMLANEQSVGLKYSDLCREMARAAIEAMREPTEHMLEMGGTNFNPEDRMDVAVSWPLMIDTALGKSAVSPDLDKAIQDELDHPPASIVKEG